MPDIPFSLKRRGKPMAKLPAGIELKTLKMTFGYNQEYSFNVIVINWNDVFFRVARLRETFTCRWKGVALVRQWFPRSWTCVAGVQDSFTCSGTSAATLLWYFPKGWPPAAQTADPYTRFGSSLTSCRYLHNGYILIKLCIGAFLFFRDLCVSKYTHFENTHKYFRNIFKKQIGIFLAWTVIQQFTGDTKPFVCHGKFRREGDVTFVEAFIRFWFYSQANLYVVILQHSDKKMSRRDRSPVDKATWCFIYRACVPDGTMFYFLHWTLLSFMLYNSFSQIYVCMEIRGARGATVAHGHFIMCDIFAIEDKYRQTVNTRIT